MGKEYSYNDVYENTSKYFNGDDLATTVWISKYCKKELDDNGIIHYYELTPDDMHHRLASEFYRAGLKYNNPLSEEEIYNLFKDFKYIVPQGRPMAGIGINDAVSISNCFVVGKPNQDSYGTIALIDQQIMQISKRGGGVGTDLSNYRPNGSKVHNAAMTSSGPVEICANRFSNTIREVGQCIEENQRVITENGLIKIKDVKIGDKVWTKKGFIEVLNVINNGEKELFKVKTKKGFEIITSKDHVYLSTVNGNPVEKKLSELNIGDNISLLNKPSEEKIILSEDQISSIEQVENGIAYDLSLADENLFWCEGIYVHNCGRRGALLESMSIYHPDVEKFIDSKMEDGKITGANISVKLYDKWIKEALDTVTIDKDKKRLWKKIIHNATTKAEPGVLFWDTIIKESVPDCYKDFGFETTCTNPCFRGDMKILTKNGIYKTFSELSKLDNCKLTNENGEVVNGKIWSNGIKEVYKIYLSNNKFIYCTKNHRFKTIDDEDKEIQYCVGEEIKGYNGDSYIVRKIENIGNDEVFDFHLDNDNHWGIVEGVIVHNCGEICLCPYDSCRLMLLNLYSYVENPFTEKSSFNYKLFADHCRKIMKLMDNMIDLEIEKIDRIILKVENDPEDDATKAIELDLWKNIKRMCLLGRRSGIGITAEGDMLAALGYKYGTKEATSFAAEIQRLLALNVYIESCDLVQIDGRSPFECFNYELEKDNPFLNRLASSSEYYSQEFKSKWKNGRRNIALLTISPAGSVSIETQTTSGIEPLFMVKYKRRRKLDIDSLIKPDFIDKNGDKFSEYNVVHNKFIKWYSIYENIDFNTAREILEKIGDEEFDNIFKESPYFRATSNDCNWVEKVHMQGEIQKYIDHSISVTVNLPKGTTEDVVEQVYEEAWKSGCKGCTIYVDGSRDGVLIKEEKKNKKEDCHCKDFINADVPTRPKTLPCKLIRFSNNREKWIAAVGMYEDKPYEIFTGLLEKLNISNNINEGFIVKEKCDRESLDEDGNTKIIQTSCYYLEYIDDKKQKIRIDTPLSETFNEEYWNYAKMVSGLLQGIPLNYAIKIIKSLKLGDDTINTWKNGVIRALKRFLKEDEELDDVCPECGAKLWRISGCIQCNNCGYSKCN